MLKTFIFFSLALLLSLSIVGPSFFALLPNSMDIEIVQDFEEEKSDPSVEVEENEKILTDFTSLFLFETHSQKCFSHYYLITKYTHSQDIHSPPPDLS